MLLDSSRAVARRRRGRTRDNKGDAMAEVNLHDGESIENALRRFKRQVLQEDIIKEAKRRSYYLKPGQKKRLKSVLARKRDRKRKRRDNIPESKTAVRTEARPPGSQ